MKKYKVMMFAVLGIIVLLLSFAPMPAATTVGQEIDEPRSANISAKVGGGGVGSMGEVSSVNMGGVASGIENYVDMGKGLEEPCYPYCECMVFGAELGEPDANDWNCVPEVIESTDSFNLSTITPNHEVVVALIVFYDVDSELDITFKWYRNRDNKLIHQGWYTIPDPQEYGYDYWEWYYVYYYIGYTPEEIWENGNYHLHIIWSPSDFRVLDFQVEGIPPPLKRYAPVLYFHPYENYYTNPIDSMLEQSDLKNIEYENFSLCNPTTSQLSTYNTSEYYTDMRNAEPAPFGWPFLNVTPEPPLPSRFSVYPFTVYGRQVDKTYEGDDYIVLQYWFFYPYNYWLNCHEGDWERIQIICDNSTGEPTPINVTFGQHWGGETIPWGEVNFAAETHPEVFVGVGSHSSWPTDGLHLLDLTSDNGIVSFPNYVSSSEDSYALTDISSGHSWVKWQGTWGCFVPGILNGLGQCGCASPANLFVIYNWTTHEGVNIWDDPIGWAKHPGSPWIIGKATGSVRLHVHDSNGNHTGLNETGWIETEIPGTYFYIPASNQSEAELMWIYTEENLTFTIEASEVGECNFSFARCVGGEITTNYTHVEVIKNTTAKVDTGEENPLLLMELDFDSDGVTDEYKFPDSNSILKGQVNFTGRDTPPNDRWIEPFVVKLFESGNLSNVLWTGVVTTNNTGVFTIDNVPSGTYDIGIKNWTCLSELVTNVTVGVNETTVVDFGTTREGDADGNDAVTSMDFSLLAGAFGSTPVDPNWNPNCDFDRNGAVTIMDFSLLAGSFGQCGDLYGV